MPLVPCPQCFRHARIEEVDCPFCQQHFDEASQRVRSSSVRVGVPAALGLKRALVYAIGTGTLALTACDGETPERSQAAAASASAEPEVAEPNEPSVEYEIQWRSLTDEELRAITYPKVQPQTATPQPKSQRVRVRRVPLDDDVASDAMYGGPI